MHGAEVTWTIIAILLAPVAMLLVLPLISDACSLATLAFGARRSAGAPANSAPRAHLLVLVPAHDEELLVGAAVRSMMAMSRGHCDFDVVVIADNCTDRTAAIAAGAGARVLERFDAERRGKPWALEWAMARLPVSEYDAVVINDADTIVHAGFVDGLALRGPLRAKVVQGYNAIANPRESWLTALGALLNAMRYEGQYTLKYRAGLNCPIGNGWCVGTDLLAAGGWPSDSLCEDWELYARYTTLGARLELATGAISSAQLPHTLEQSAVQRKRWQAGKLIVFRDYWARILTSSRIGWRQKLDSIGELAAPGPVLHASVAAPVAFALAWAPGATAHAVAALFALSLVPTVVWSTVAWSHQAERGRLLLLLARLPFYAMWRLVVGVQAFATGRRGAWLRSPRHSTVQGIAP